MILVLARVHALRLLRTPRAWLPVAGWALLGLGAALAVRIGAATSGATHVMQGVFGAVVLPFVAHAIVGATLGDSGMAASIRGLVSLGATPRRAAVAATAVSVAASAVVSAGLGLLVAGLAHTIGDPPLAADLFASTWVSGLGGGAYAALFAVGSAFWRGAGRSVLLVLDWTFGGSAGVTALFFPRGHVTSLLGGELPADLPARVSPAALLLLILAYGALTALFTRRRGA